MVNTEPLTTTLRAYARHRGLSSSYVHRLISNGVIQRGDDGQINIAAADGILDARAALASPLRIAANAAQRKARPAAEPVPDRAQGTAGAQRQVEAPTLDR